MATRNDTGHKNCLKLLSIIQYKKEKVHTLPLYAPTQSAVIAIVIQIIAASENMRSIYKKINSIIKRALFSYSNRVLVSTNCFVT